MKTLHRILLLLVLWVVRFPRLALVVAGVVLALSATWAGLNLQISSDQNKLFDPNVKFFKDYLHFTEQFPENEATYALIEPADPARMPPVLRWTALADAITDKLKTLPEVKSVDSHIPTKQLGPQGLLFDTPESVKKNLEGMKQFVQLIQLWAEKPHGLIGFLGSTPLERFLAAINTQKPDADMAQFMALLASSWNQALAKTDAALMPGSTLPDLAVLDAGDPSRLGYYYVPDASDPSRHIMLVRIYDRTEHDSLTSTSETLDAIRRAVDQVAQGYPEFSVNLTGRPALEADEMRTTDRDSHKAEVVALSCVFVGLVVMLRSIWLALVGEIVLGVGIGWTFGWATLSVGELNLLSVVFLLALIGIGMDYLVQILMRYRQEALIHKRPERIWVTVFNQVAMPINTACAGAAGAFLVSALTHFRGAAQLGIIAGGGLVLCLAAGYVVLPAVLTLFPMKRPRGTHRAKLGPPARASWRTIVFPLAWFSMLGLGIPFMLKAHFDPGLLNMQSQTLPSVRLVRKLQTWSAVVLSKDLQTLRRVRSAMEHCPSVGNTESILDAYDNRDWLRAHQQELPMIAWAEPAAVEPGKLSAIANKSRKLSKSFADAIAGSQTPIDYAWAALQLAHTADVLAKADDQAAPALAQRLSEWQRGFVQELRSSVAPFRSPEVNVNALPPELKDHFVGKDGSYALYVYPKNDLWDQAQLKRFVHEVEAAADPVSGDFLLTGIALDVYHSTASINKAFYHATAYALGLILFLVLIDLRSLTQTALAVSVLALGLPMLLVVMGLMNVDWNFANFFGLPILIGAGHEYGVFLVHRYKEAKQDPRRVWRRWDAADRGLLLCAFVTCTSFGFFWLLANHQGLRSLGLVMTIGTACIYLSAVMVLRPLLIWRLRRSALPPEPQQLSRPLHREVWN